MAQLTDDCFAFGGSIMTVEDALAQIRARILPVEGVERCPLARARGRVLSEHVIAQAALPPFDNSAVDGYAVRHADLAQSGISRFRISDRVQAGATAASEIAAGTAIRIFTGAQMPSGADTVFMQEDCTAEGGNVFLPPGLKLGANRRKSGEDVSVGAVVLKSGTRLGPQHIAMAAGVGLKDLPVYRRVSVALFSTGDEIAEAGQALGSAQIYDANRPLLAEMATALGAEVTDLGILRDDPVHLAQALADAAADHDLVLTSGGVSTGEADYVRQAVETIGNLVFWRVAIKPGRPVALGVLPGNPGSQAAFAGLPGNPVAAFVTFALIVRPLILRLAGADVEPLTSWPVRLAFAYKKKSGRREFVRVALRPGQGGMMDAHKYRQDGAGVISSLTETDGLVELADDLTTLEAGSVVRFLPYETVIGAK